MEKSARFVLDAVLRRVRGEGGFAHSDELGLDVLSKCQRLSNIKSRKLIEEATFSTIPRKVFYALSDVLPSAIEVQTVLRGNASMVRLEHYSGMPALFGLGWFRKMGSEAKVWCQVGRTHLIVWPATESAETLTARYVKLTDKLESFDDDLEIPDEELEHVETLAEIVFLLRQRSVLEAVALMKGFKDD